MQDSHGISDSADERLSLLSEKLQCLAEEISEGIHNLSDNDVGKVEIQRDIESIIEISSKEKASEAVVNIMLFRKYADIANVFKDSGRYVNKDNLVVELPSYVFDTNDAHLTGWSALKEKIFWLRMVASALAFISFVVMSTVPNISSAEFEPGNYLFTSCQYHDMEGSFNYRSYQVVLALGVIVYFYNAVFAVYYLLPTDRNKRKFIPGFSELLGTCMEQERANELAARCSVFCTTFSKFIEMFCDAALLLLTTAVAIIASIVLERPREFTFTYQASPQAMYYTIGSFYSTFTSDHLQSRCTDEYHNPGQKIRASLAMTYLTTMALALCFLVSFMAFHKEMKSGSNQELACGGLHSNEDNDEQVVEFSALPNNSRHDKGLNGIYEC